jgi:Hermansky-Pudlak syndrome 5 protein
MIKIANDQQTIAYANTFGDIALYSLKNLISKSSRVKLSSGAASALYWRFDDKEIYVGDTTGNVSVISLSFFIGRNLLNVISLNPILMLDSKICQIDGFNDWLLVSSMSKTILCNNDREEFKQIGNRPRDGTFGACFCVDFESLESQQSQVATIDEFEYERLLMDNVTIYCSRPGMRLWQADLNGNIRATHQYKNTNFAKEQVKLLSEGAFNQPDSMDKANQFQLVTSLCNVFVFTWNCNGFYVVDPVHSKILFWTNEFNGLVVATKVVDSSIYVYLRDGRLIELKFYKLQHYALQLCHTENFSKAAEIIRNNSDYFLHLLRESQPNNFRIFLKIRDYLIANELNESLKSLHDIFEEISAKKVQNVVILSKNTFNNQEKVDKNKCEEKQEIEVPENIPPEDDTQSINRAVRQLYILHQTSLISNLNFRERLSKIFDQFKNSGIIKILGELELLFVENSDYTNDVSKKVVCRMFLDYLQPEIIFEIDDEKTLSFIANALIEVQNKDAEISRCKRCEFPINCGNSPSGYEEIGNILQQFYWSRGEYEKCFELCRCLPYLLKITGKFITDEKKFDKMIPYAINLGCLEILHKSLELFNDISLFHQLLDEYLNACMGKFKCLKCDELNEEVTEVGKILTWDAIFQAIEYYLCGDELLELLMRFSQFIPNGALSRQFYMKLLLHSN